MNLTHLADLPENPLDKLCGFRINPQKNAVHGANGYWIMAAYIIFF